MWEMARETGKGPKTGKDGKRTMTGFLGRKKAGRPRTRTRHERQEGYDWKKYPKKGWPYTGLDDPNYIQDKYDLIHEHGNGWYWYAGTPQFKEYIDKRKILLSEDQTHN